MRRFMTLVGLAAVTFALLVALPSSSAQASPACDPMNDFVVFKVRTANGWGEERCTLPGSDNIAGCYGCTLTAFLAKSEVRDSIGYRVRTPNGWGDYKYDGAKAGYLSGCAGCQIEAIQIFGASPDWGSNRDGIKYRIRSAVDWGDWKEWRSGRAPEVAGFFGCTIQLIQIDIFSYNP